ncbi:MAG: hypothetical protein KF773_38260 [Deltaproteobacteria bacterium]|nr:hypothetical protein [Deltaproteobacteria bacterium]MCW5808213.1 hypothetical protein [Deltaproteobacteria bacterium]
MSDAPFSLHAPEHRVAVGCADDWELRRAGDARRGFAHVQLWRARDGISIVTPSRRTAGHFEARLADGEHVRSRWWRPLELHLRARAIAVPGPRAIDALERWFVLRHETGAGRLLRAWWAACA